MSSAIITLRHGSPLEALVSLLGAAKIKENTKQRTSNDFIFVLHFLRTITNSSAKLV